MALKSLLTRSTRLRHLEWSKSPECLAYSLKVLGCFDTRDVEFRRPTRYQRLALGRPISISISISIYRYPTTTPASMFVIVIFSYTVVRTVPASCYTAQ